MPRTLRKLGVAFQRAVNDFVNDGGPTQAAALAYYALFSLPPLIVIVTSVADSIFDHETVREEVIERAHVMFGPAAADQIRTIVERAAGPSPGFELATIISVGALVFASTSAFTQLQSSLNRAWGVEEDPHGRGVVHTFFLKRTVSFVLVLLLGLSLLLSIAFSAALSSLGDRFAVGIGEERVLHTAAFFISWAVFAALIAAAFYFLPDARVPPLDALFGAVATALAFAAGKQLLGLYIGHAAIGSAYGSASSLALTLLWFYFSAATLLFGAEFTEAWSARTGGPRRGAGGRISRPQPASRPGR